MMRLRLFRQILLKSSGLLLLAFILWKSDRHAIAAAFAQVSITQIFPAFFLFLALSFLKTERWKILLNNSGMNSQNNPLFAIYVGAFLIGAITPGRIGEIFKYKMVTGKELDSDAGFVLAVQDRIWDLSFTLIVGSAFLLWLFPEISYVIGFFPWCCWLLSLTYFPEIYVRWLAQAGKRFIPDNRVTRRLSLLSESMSPLSAKDMGKCTLLTIGSWCIYFFQVWWVYRATGAIEHLVFLACVTAAAGLIALLPISIAGIGTRDMALIGLFSLSGRPPAAAVVLSACILAIFLANCLISFPFWLFLSYTHGNSLSKRPNTL